jgi:hypothetical protein
MGDIQASQVKAAWLRHDRSRYTLVFELQDGREVEVETIATNEDDAYLIAETAHGLSRSGWRSTWMGLGSPCWRHR